MEDAPLRRTWSASSSFNVEITRHISPQLTSSSNGIAQGDVFPEPVLAIAVASSPGVSASATSIRQSFGVMAPSGSRARERTPGSLGAVAFPFRPSLGKQLVRELSLLLERAVHGSR